MSGIHSGTAQSIYIGGDDIALKSGESTELGQIYYIGVNCQSLLQAPPGVEILDGLRASPPPSVKRTSFLLMWAVRLRSQEANW